MNTLKLTDEQIGEILHAIDFRSNVIERRKLKDDAESDFYDAKLSRLRDLRHNIVRQLTKP